MASTPDQVTGLVHWWRADNIAVADAAPVTSWTARTGGVTVTQATTTAQPLYQVAGIGGQPSVRFDGTDDFLAGTLTAAIAQPCSTVAIVQVGTVANDGQAYNCGLELSVISGAWQAWVGTSVNAGAVTAAIPYAVITTAQSTGTNSVVYANGTAGTPTTGTGTITTALQMGRHASQTRWWFGDIAELLIYNRAVTANDRAIIDTYAAQRYGATVTDMLPTVVPPQRNSAARRRASLW